MFCVWACCVVSGAKLSTAPYIHVHRTRPVFASRPRETDEDYCFTYISPAKLSPSSSPCVLSPDRRFVQFSAVAENVFPEEYEIFLSYLRFVNFDIGIVVSYSCLFSPNFYGRLLVTTITPLLLLMILGLTYYAAKNRYRESPHHILDSRLLTLVCDA